MQGKVIFFLYNQKIWNRQYFKEIKYKILWNFRIQYMLYNYHQNITKIVRLICRRILFAVSILLTENTRSNYSCCSSYLKILIQNYKKEKQTKAKKKSTAIILHTFIFYRSFSSAQVKLNWLIITTKWMFELPKKIRNDLKGLRKRGKLRRVLALALWSWTKSANKFSMKILHYSIS